MGFDMNYKIKVANESGNREVQDLFRELGGGWGSRVDSDHYGKEFLYLTNGIIEYDDSISEFESVDECEEITLPELRDLVVLKRNDVGDASYTYGDYKVLKLDSMDYKIWNVESETWADHIGSQTDLRRGLKPIEKKEMKEYLVKDVITDDYFLTKNHSKFVGAIEIPEGANGYYQYTEGEPDNTFFLKKIGDTYFFANEHNDYSWDWYAGEMQGHEFALWQRSESPNDKLASAEQYRQAEVLPFIDDEPKNVDLASGCNLDELAKEHGYRDRDIGESCLCYRESLKIFIARHKSREWDLSDYDFAESDAWIESNVEQDNVNNPSHYADGEIECIDAIQSSMTHEAFCGYLKGNIQKYIWRYEKKGGIESLKKGQWYLDKLISVL